MAMAKDGTTADNYCPIGDTEPAWCAHCRDRAAGLSGAEIAARDKSIPPANASIGLPSRTASADDSEPEPAPPVLRPVWIWYDQSKRD